MKTHSDKIEQRRVVDLQASPQNSRVHSSAQILALAKSVELFGFTRPVLILGSGEIVAGHGAVEAAKHLALETVPCRVLRGMTADEARAYVIVDNRISDMSEWDNDVLQQELIWAEHAGQNLEFLAFEFEAMDEEEIAAAAVDANAAAADDDVSPEGKAKNVYPVVLALSRNQYERWHKKKGSMSDLSFVDHLLEVA